MYHVLCWFIILFSLLSVIVPVYINFFDHKDLGNHLLQLCPKVVKRPVYIETVPHNTSFDQFCSCLLVSAVIMSHHQAFCNC